MERFPQQGQSRKRKSPERGNLIDVFSGLSIRDNKKPKYRFFFDDGEKIDGFTLPVASKAFLRADQQCIFNDRNQLQSRFLAGKIEKDLTRYNTLTRVLTDVNVPTKATIQKLNRVDLDYFNYAVTNVNNLPLELKKEILAYFIEILKRYHENREKAKVKRDFNILKQYNQEVGDAIDISINKEYSFNEISLMETVSDKFYDNFITGKKDVDKEPAKIKGLFFGFFKDKKEQNLENDFEPDFITIDDLDLLI